MPDCEVLSIPIRATQVRYYFSQHVTSAIGTPLVDGRTLASYGVLEGDLIFCASMLEDADDGDE